MCVHVPTKLSGSFIGYLKKIRETKAVESVDEARHTWELIKAEKHFPLPIQPSSVVLFLFCVAFKLKSAPIVSC